MAVFICSELGLEPTTFCVAKIVASREENEAKKCLHFFANERKSLKGANLAPQYILQTNEEGFSLQSYPCNQNR